MTGKASKLRYQPTGSNNGQGSSTQTGYPTDESGHYNGARVNADGTLEAEVTYARDRRRQGSSGVVAFVDRLLDYVFAIPDFFVSLVMGILSRFTASGGAGTRIVAGFLAGAGTLLSADPFWQLFGMNPIFPFFETDHLGFWRTILMLINNWLLLLFCLVLSGGVQWIESWGLRGQDPDTAKLKYERQKHHLLPKLNPRSISYVKHLHGNYQRAKMRDVRFKQLLVLAALGFDIASFFVSRNPIGMAPALAFGCLLYNLLAMVSGEVGIRLWHIAKYADLDI